MFVLRFYQRELPGSFQGSAYWDAYDFHIFEIHFFYFHIFMKSLPRV